MGVIPNKSGLTIGEAREQMAMDLYKILEGVIDRRSRLPGKYWILVVVKPDLSITGGRGIKETILTMQVKPPAMLGSICFEVDNNKSDVERLWVYPFDYAASPEVAAEGSSASEQIAKFKENG